MANKKEEYYVVYKTKEDFEKWYNKVRSCGYEDGYKDGLVRALGYILNCVDDNFDDEVRKDAEYESRHIGINNWRRKQAIEEEIKKRAIDEYIRKQKEEAEKQQG